MKGVISPPPAASDVGGAPAGVRGAQTRAAQQPHGGGHSRFPAPARREVLAPRRSGVPGGGTEDARWQI